MLPTPAIVDYMPDGQLNLVRPLDVLEVDVFGVEELSKEVQVGANGALDFPLIGSVTAMGRTTQELAHDIEGRLRGSFVLDPDVTLRITERAVQNFVVGGEVKDAGRYPLTEPITLMEAVAIGGGMDRFATRNEVLIFRTVNGERYIGVYDLRGIQRGNYADPTVYPNDVVMVGDSPARRRLDTVLQITAALASPLLLLERVLTD